MTEPLPLQTDRRSDPEADLARLERSVGRFERLVVAFSGGVDSAVLLAAAVRALGDRALAVTADSPSIPRHELEAAKDLARSIGARHRIVATGEMEIEAYRRNDVERCYWCKSTLFSACADVGREEGADAIAYGYTADDVGDYRPGHRAATEAKVHAPLLEAGLGKEAIRAIARHLGLTVSEKPAAPCLASRIPYGSPVTDEKLGAIESVENVLRRLGFSQFRARYDGTTLRLEVEGGEIARAASPEVRSEIAAAARDAGARYVTLDLEGFRSGSLNEGTVR
jgi:pyridinium-3,5-biscarboxylic acid mononucleotide sulfurtransferase